MMKVARRYRDFNYKLVFKKKWDTLDVIYVKYKAQLITKGSSQVKKYWL